MASAAEKRHMNLVAQVGCVICRNGGRAPDTPVEVHHIALGSGQRSSFSTVGLCVEHHRGGFGLHGMGSKKFCVRYRPPGDSEYGLLVLVNKYRAIDKI